MLSTKTVLNRNRIKQKSMNSLSVCKPRKGWDKMFKKNKGTIESHQILNNIPIGDGFMNEWVW